MDAQEKQMRHIFGWTAEPRAMDYYERVLMNHPLGTQDGDGMKMLRSAQHDRLSLS